ncbi:MAG: TIGR03790 family protein [Verrucomicrobiia bacterium]
MPDVVKVWWGVAVCLLVGGLRLEGSPPAPSPLQDRLLVVFNRNDPEAEGLARYYAERRGIPEERVLGIECPVTETVSRDDFDRTIRKPISDYLESKGWLRRVPKMIGDLPVLMARDNQIWAMALMRGIPLKIEDDPGIPAPEGIPPPLRTNAAAVDSELALITFVNLPLAGFISNLYYSNDSSPDLPERASGVRPFNQQFADFLILVCRLDAPEAEQVRQMIDDAIETERLELTGRAYVDTRGITDKEDPYILGDEWLRRTAELFRASGFETVVDEAPPVVPAWEPWEDVALYAGWYALHAGGPMTREGFRFRRGAVAYHIHSFSASSVRTPERNWVGPFLARGVTATMGSVYEPYLRFTPEVPTFFAALLNGLTFAEAAYQSQLALSWMITNVGDPLYRPFPRNFYVNLEAARATEHPNTSWLRLREARLTYESGKVGETRRILSSLVEKGSCPVLQEGYADLMATFVPDRQEAWRVYRELLESLKEPLRRIRVGVKLARSLEQRGRAREALEVYDRLVTEHPAEAGEFRVPQRAYALVSAERIREVPAGLAPLIRQMEQEAARAGTVTSEQTVPEAPRPPEPPGPPGPPLPRVPGD